MLTRSIIGLVVVLAVVGGGLAWWLLDTGEDPIETMATLTQACSQLEQVQDVDIRVYTAFYLDGKLDSYGYAHAYISGKNIHTVTESTDDWDKSQLLHYDGANYILDANDKWRQKTPTGQTAPSWGFPFSTEALCPNLTHFTFANVEDVEDQAAKKFTAPTLSGEPYDKPPAYGQGQETRDWEIWVNEQGWVVRIAGTTVGHDDPGSPHLTVKFVLDYSGHGEPNILPHPKK